MRSYTFREVLVIVRVCYGFVGVLFGELSALSWAVILHPVDLNIVQLGSGMAVLVNDNASLESCPVW